MIRAYPQPWVIVLGPTASGKTSLGVALAKRFKGVILSADSRQVYRGLDAGTAKIKPPEMRGVRHFLLDIASPKRQLTVAQFQRAAQSVLTRIPKSTPVFIVGGSPFYIDAILNQSPFPEVPPNPKLRRKLEKRTAAQLFLQLRRRDPRRAAGIDPKNKHRLIRALEIVEALGAVPKLKSRGPRPALKLGINLPRQVLYRRIDQRLDQRMPRILREIKRLHRNGLAWTRMDKLGLEYRWGSRIVRGPIERAVGVDRLKGDIHAFARRQLTWWRRDSSIHWISKPKHAEQLVRRYLTRQG